MDSQEIGNHLNDRVHGGNQITNAVTCKFLRIANIMPDPEAVPSTDSSASKQNNMDQSSFPPVSPFILKQPEPPRYNYRKGVRLLP
jgi:hypothetical protein